MRKKIRFPLIMEDGVVVRTLDELKKHFNIDKVVGYYLDGRLEVWLKDRSYLKEVQVMSQLDKKSDTFLPDLCEIIGVEFNKFKSSINIKDIEIRNERIGKLKQYIDDKFWEAKIDDIVFKQEELEEKLSILKLNKSKLETIYLCGEKFTISSEVKNINYVGVNKVAVKIHENKQIDYKALNISFENIDLGLNINKNNKEIIQEDNYGYKDKGINRYNYGKAHVSNDFIKIYIDLDGKINSNFGGNPKFNAKLVDVDCNFNMSKTVFVAVDQNGKVYQWGEGINKWQPIPNNLPKINQVAIGDSTIFALDENGKLHWWGSNSVIHGFETHEMPQVDSKIIQIKGGKGGSFIALDEEGKLYTWGMYSSSFINIPTNLPPIKKIEIDDSGHILIALDIYGKVHYCSSKTTKGYYTVPYSLPKIVDIAYFSEYTYLALDENGKLHIWGKESYEYLSCINRLSNPKFIGYGIVIDNEGRVYRRSRDIGNLSMGLEEDKFNLKIKDVMILNRID